MVGRVFDDNVPFTHKSDVAFGSTLLYVQDLLQLFAKVYVGDMCLSPEDVTGYVHQFPFITLLLFFEVLLPHVHMHPGFLVMRKKHQRNVKRASDPYFLDIH